MKKDSGSIVKMRSGTWYGELDENARVEKATFSEELRQMLGYDQIDFPGTFDIMLEIVHPDDRQKMLDVTGATLEARSVPLIRNFA